MSFDSLNTDQLQGSGLDPDQIKQTLSGSMEFPSLNIPSSSQNVGKKNGAQSGFSDQWQKCLCWHCGNMVVTLASDPGVPALHLC